MTNLNKTTQDKIPKLRFNEFAELWEEKRLGDIAEIVGGGTPETFKPEYWNGDIKWYTPTELSAKYISDSVRKITALGLNKSSAKLLPSGTVLLSSRATVGDASIATTECTTNQGFQSLIVHNDNNNEFCYYWIANNKKAFIKRASGSTFLEISKGEITKVKYNCPSLPEQEKIAAFLSSVDERVSQLTKKKELLEKYKKGVMQKIFNQDIRFKDDNGNDFPDWQENTLGEIATFSKGKGISKSDIDNSGQTECIRYGELYTHYKEIIKEVRSKTNVSRCDLVLSESNDVIIPASGETQIDIATAACVLKNNVALSGDINIIKSKINGIFLSYYLNSKCKYDIASISQGKSVVHLYANQLKTLKVKYPCPVEQQKIAEFLTTIDDKIKLAGWELEKAQEFKKGLLQQMFV